MPRGIETYYDEYDDVDRYVDDDSIVPEDVVHPCALCKKMPVDVNNTGNQFEMHDACIANLDNVKFACCGHGSSPFQTYVVINDGPILRWQDAIDEFKRQGKDVDHLPRPWGDDLLGWLTAIYTDGGWDPEDARQVAEDHLAFYEEERSGKIKLLSMDDEDLY